MGVDQVLQKIKARQDVRQRNDAAKAFAKGKPLFIWSRVLGETVCLALTEQVKKEAEGKGLVAYLPTEVLAMEKISPEKLRKIHLVKKMFEGTVTSCGGKASSRGYPYRANARDEARAPTQTLPQFGTK